MRLWRSRIRIVPPLLLPFIVIFWLLRGDPHLDPTPPPLVPPPSEEFRRRSAHVLKLLGYGPSAPPLLNRAGRRREGRMAPSVRRHYEAWKRRRDAALRPKRPRFKRLWPFVMKLPAKWRGAVALMLIPPLMGAAGMIFVVAPTGLDSGAGTVASPWRTIERAWQTVGASDFIQARGGTYPPAVFDTFSGSNRLRASVTIENFPGETARFTYNVAGNKLWRFRTQTGLTVRSNPAGGLLQLDYTGTYGEEILPGGNEVGYAALWMDGGSDTTIDGVEVQHSYGICVLLTGTDQTVSNCDLSHGGYGVQARSATRPVIEFNRIHDIDRMMQNDTTASNDHGGEGINLTHGTTGAHVQWNVAYNCRAITSGSYDYGIDGGFCSCYALNPAEQTIIEWNLAFDNHGFLEQGAELANFPTWTNSNVIVRHNIVAGRQDFQSDGKNPGGGPKTPIMLIRAGSDWIIEHNTFDRTDGSTADGGIRVITGTGGFFAPILNYSIRSNVFRLRINEHAIRFNNLTIPASWTIDYNLIYRVNPAHTQNAISINGGATTYAYSSAGLTAWRAGTPHGDNDIWVQDPLFVDVSNANVELRDYHPATGSPLIGAAHDGGEIGALEYDAPAGALASDDFSVPGALNGSTADTGGTWTGVTAGSSTMTIAGGTLNIVNAASGNTNRASLLSVSATDVTVKFRWKSDKVATGGSQVITPMARQLAVGDGYGAQIILQTSGQVHANFVRLNGGVQNPITTATNTGLATNTAGTEYWITLQLEGTSPTTLRVKVWRVADPEPVGWTFTTTDSTAAHQVAGGVGFRATGSGTNQPITFTIDDFNATGPASGGFDIFGAASMGGVGSLSASGQVIRRASVSLAGAGSLSATAAEYIREGSAALAGAGALTAAAEVIELVIPPVVIPPTLDDVLRGTNVVPVARLVFLTDLDTELAVVENVLLGGEVRKDRTAELRASGSVIIDNSSGVYTTTDYSSLVAPFRLVALERGAMVGSTPVYRRLMTGLIDENASAVDSAQIGFDVWSRLRLADQQFNLPASFLKGARVGVVIRSIAESAGLGIVDEWYLIDDGGATLDADRSYDVGDNQLRSMVELAFHHGLELFDDSLGRLVLRPFREPAALVPVWDFTLQTLTLQRTLYGRLPVNRQEVAGIGPDLYPIRASVRDLNPASPTFNPPDGSGPLGDRPGTPYVSAEIRTQVQANAVALQLLYERNLADEAGQADVIPIPGIEAGDVVLFADEERVLVDSLSIPLGEGAMRLSWRGTRSLTQ